MLTSHCRHCGAAKEPADYAADFCAGCASVRNETREFVTRENQERNEHNSKILTPEVKQRLVEAAESDMTGATARNLTQSLGLKPIIDLSTALKEAMLARAHSTNSGHADPRSVFNPGLRDSRVANLGMGAKVPPGRTLVPGAMPTEGPPSAQ